MGFVWNVILSFDDDELWEDGEDEPRETCEPLVRINAWIRHGSTPTSALVSLIGPTYAGKSGFGMDANLYGGGFKHFDIDGFIEVVKAQDWKMRSKVQLWVKGAQEGMGAEPFTLIKLGRPPSSRPKPKAKFTSRKSGRMAKVALANKKQSKGS